MANKTVDDFLMEAKRVMFIQPKDNNGVATVFVIFDDINTGIALYTEVVRVNETKPQYLGFKKSHSSIILSFILERTNRPHAKMLLDYDEKEFDDFITVVPSNEPYVILFGGIEDGHRRIGGFDKSPVMMNQYLLE